MSATKLELFLARIYSEENLRSRFLADRRGVSAAAGLTAEECTALENIDLVGLQLAFASFAKKRSAQSAKNSRSGLAAWFRRFGPAKRHRAPS